MRALDWLFRTAMLALAGLVTLAMLASIAAISTEAGPGGFIAGGERRAPEPAAEPGLDRPERTAAPSSQGDDEMVAGTAASGAAKADRDPGRWLEAIAYALLALAGLLAIALLLLASAARDLKRIADSLSGRPR
jgi:hypothetical protein